MSAAPTLVHSGAVKLSAACAAIGHVRGRLNDSLAPATRTADHERFLGALECAGNLICQRPALGYGRRLESRRCCPLQYPDEPDCRGGMECSRGDVVEPSTMRRRNIERPLRVLRRISHTEIQPQGIFRFLTASISCWRTDCRTDKAIRGATLVKSSPRMEIVRLLDLAQRRRPHRTAPRGSQS